MHSTSSSEYVAMAVARDLTWSARESPNIKGVLLLQRQWKLGGTDNPISAFVLCFLSLFCSHD